MGNKQEYIYIYIYIYKTNDHTILSFRKHEINTRHMYRYTLFKHDLRYSITVNSSSRIGIPQSHNVQRALSVHVGYPGYTEPFCLNSPMCMFEKGNQLYRSS
jgi:hypothetical protein